MDKLSLTVNASVQQAKYLQNSFDTVIMEKVKEITEKVDYSVNLANKVNEWYVEINQRFTTVQGK